MPDVFSLCASTRMRSGSGKQRLVLFIAKAVKHASHKDHERDQRGCGEPPANGLRKGLVVKRDVNS